MADLTAGQRRRQRKAKFADKLVKMLDEYKNALVVGIDNVGSLQMQKVRKALRGKAEVLCGKKTLVRKVMRDNLQRNQKLEALLPFLRGNVALVFTNDELLPIRNIVTEFKVPAAAKSGQFAPKDVIIPAGPTGMDPGQTSFFQALSIATKIARGSIEIINEVLLCKKGDKVTSSMTALLSKLDIKPFFYGMTVSMCFENGSMYPAEVLDLTPEDLLKKFFNGVAKLTALSLGAAWPNELTIPHSISNGFKKLLAIGLASGYEFKEAKEFLEKAKNAVAAAPAAAAPAEAKKEDKKEDKKEEAPAEEDVAVGGLFD